MKRYCWLIFDADNTLFDFDLAQEKAFYSLLKDENIKNTTGIYAIYQEINHRAWQALETGAISTQEIKHIRFEQLFSQIGHSGNSRTAGSRYLNHLSKHSDLLNGAEQLLQYLAGDYRMLLMTNGLTDVQRPRFKHSPILHYFETIIISEEVGFAKPDPKIFETAFNKRSVDKTQVLMIGDNLLSDIAGGINWGVDTCWYNPSQKENQSGIVPSYEVSSFKTLKALLKINHTRDEL